MGTTKQNERSVAPHTIITPSSDYGNYWMDVFNSRELIFFLAWRDLVVRYKQTAVGFAWTILKPLATLLVYTFVFGYVAQLPSNGTPYVLLVLTGLLVWQLFSSVLSVTSESLIANAHLVSKVYFPRIVIPLSSVAVCVVDHLISFALIALLLVWYAILPGWQILLFPLVTLLVTLTALGLGLITAALNVYFRDFRQIVPLCLQLGVFASPVAYATSVLPSHWQSVYALNPVVGLIDAFRWCVLGNSQLIYTPSILVTVLFAAGALFYGLWLFRRYENTFADAM